MTESEVWRQAYNAALTGSCTPLADSGFDVIAVECAAHADHALNLYRENRGAVDADAAAELAWLTWFVQNADFGPADGDVCRIMEENYTAETGNKVPSNWSCNTEENDD